MGRGARMPIAAAIAAWTVAACVTHPDPRFISVRDAQRQSLGGWAIATDRDGHETRGELIAVDPGAIHVLAWTPHEALSAPAASSISGVPTAQIVHEYRASLVAIPRDRIRILQLYRYGNDHFVAWGMLGGLSTLSHFVLAGITLPLWIGLTTGSENTEVESTILTYPGDRM